MKIRTASSRLLLLIFVGIIAVSISVYYYPTFSQTSSNEERADLPKEKIEAIIRDYLLKNPEILDEMALLLEERRRKAQREQFVSNLSTLRDELTSSKSPTLGNPEAKKVIVEFSDYNCPYCRRMAPIVKETIEKNKNIRIVLREFPVLGPDSVEASKAALAAQYQGKYQEFHFALISHNGRLNKSSINKIAENVGLDMERLKKDMERSEITDSIKRNIEMAQRLGINGTPAFIVGDQLSPGAVSKEQFELLIAEAEKMSQ